MKIEPVRPLSGLTAADEALLAFESLNPDAYARAVYAAAEFPDDPGEYERRIAALAGTPQARQFCPLTVARLRRRRTPAA